MPDTYAEPYAADYERAAKEEAREFLAFRANVRAQLKRHIMTAIAALGQENSSIIDTRCDDDDHAEIMLEYFDEGLIDFQELRRLEADAGE